MSDIQERQKQAAAWYWAKRLFGTDLNERHEMVTRIMAQARAEGEEAGIRKALDRVQTCPLATTRLGAAAAIRRLLEGGGE